MKEREGESGRRRMVVIVMVKVVVVAEREMVGGSNRGCEREN